MEQTHEVPAEQRSADRPMRYTDSRMDEQVRTYFCSFCSPRVYSLKQCRCVQHAGAHVLHLIFSSSCAALTAAQASRLCVLEPGQAGPLVC